MNDIEQMLESLNPRGARPELRSRVMAVVDDELRPASPWLRRAMTAVAVSILLGVALNIWAARAADRRMASFFGDLPVPTENTRRAYAEYNAVMRALLVEMQSPPGNPPDRRTMSPTAPSGATDDRGVKYDSFLARPPVVALC